MSEIDPRVPLGAFTGDGPEILPFCILQILATTDHYVVLQTMLTVCNYLFPGQLNATCSINNPTRITGLSVDVSNFLGEQVYLVTNFPNAELVLMSQFRALQKLNVGELSAYLSVLFLSGYDISNQRRDIVFKEERRKLIQTLVTSETDILSLDDNVFEKVRSSLETNPIIRNNLTSDLMKQLKGIQFGPARIFVRVMIGLIEFDLAQNDLGLPPSFIR